MKCVKNNEKHADGEPCCNYTHIENYTTEITHERKKHPVMPSLDFRTAGTIDEDVMKALANKDMTQNR